ncbi:MAG: DUF6273 domain-containing protein [Lachnospiraceae bacterium]|nr:DUF6273 domain-containing protein [Lachnospiraceae bacterium]
MKAIQKFIALALVLFIGISILPCTFAEAKAQTVATPKITLKMAKNKKTINLSVAKNKGADGYEVYIKYEPVENELYTNVILPGKEFNGHYYVPVYDDITWTEASEKCKKAGGHLVTITSEEEYKFIKDIHSYYNEMWYGGYADESLTWHWVTGEKFDYSNWDYGQPDHWEDREDKMANSHGSYGWNDLANDSSIDGYICEWESMDDINIDNFPAMDEIRKTAYCIYINSNIESKQIDNINKKGTKKRTLKLKPKQFTDYDTNTFPAGIYSVNVRAYCKNQYGTTIYSDFATKELKVSNKETKPGYKKSYDFSNVKEGDVIKFGAYEQDADLDNGMEPIEWIVLSKTKSQIFVVSKYVLDIVPYNYDYLNDFMGTTWEKCTLRKWLNENFYNTAFNAEEKKLIKSTTVENFDNSVDGTKAGEDTVDKVFLLSMDDLVNKKYGFNKDYTKKDKNRICYPTKYCAVRKALSYENKPNTKDPEWYFLRTPADYYWSAVTVEFEGEVNPEGRQASWPIGDRPAMVISIK